MNYIRIQEIRFGTLQEKVANAIIWNVQSLMRNQETAYANCSLIYVKEDGGTIEVGEYFTVEILNAVLQQWGADDSVIDNVVLAYSPLFIKDENFARIA
jgi:hypothetical protein